MLVGAAGIEPAAGPRRSLRDRRPNVLEPGPLARLQLVQPRCSELAARIVSDRREEEVRAAGAGASDGRPSGKSSGTRASGGDVLVGAAGIEPAAPRFARHVRGGCSLSGGCAPEPPWSPVRSQGRREDALGNDLGRGGRDRTGDHLLPKQIRYRCATPRGIRIIPRATARVSVTAEPGSAYSESVPGCSAAVSASACSSASGSPFRSGYPSACSSACRSGCSWPCSSE